MKKAILQAPVGGLGDGLLFSTLPELFSNAGYQVFIDANKTRCRNREVHELLYLINPFIDGIHIGSEIGEDAIRIGIVHDKTFFLSARRFSSSMYACEFIHGFAPTHDRPKIYYSPKYLPEWADKVAFDPCSISQHFPAYVFRKFVTRLQFNEPLIKLSSPYAGRNGEETFESGAVYTVRDIFEYIDIIRSCKAFLCTESGSSSLAAAVRQDNTFALCTTQHFNSRLYVYPNVIYTTTGELTGDYLWNDCSAEGVGAW